jgi:hypothetical protein
MNDHVLFELVLKDKKLNCFWKHCEAILCHSDTALFKVKKREICISLLDSEAFCCCDTRMSLKGDKGFKFNIECSAKILLGSLVNLLKQSIRLKHSVMLFMTEDRLLQARELPSLDSIVITSVEYRLRNFHITSLKEFLLKSQEAMQFKIINTEFVKIITQLVILSGVSGGIGVLRAEPNGDQCKLFFEIQSNGGCRGVVDIDASTTTSECTMIVVPSKVIQIHYILTYLKRSQAMMMSEFTTLFLSEKGLLLQTDLKDGIKTTVFISAINDVALLQELYC